MALTPDNKEDQMKDCAPTNRPFTGTEYIESLRDGRRVYLQGERIDNVTEHPAFRNSVRSVGLWYVSHPGR